MSKITSRARISALLALTAFLGVSATHAESQSEDIEEQASNAVEQAVLRKIRSQFSVPDYTDDRSSAESLLTSFYNAINRGEFSRAYSYYGDPNPDLRDFASWVRGYENTRSIKLLIGPVDGDGGAGTVYSYLSVAIEAESYNGEKEVFGGCYTVTQAAALDQELPPFRPITLEGGTLKKSTKSLEESLPKSCMPE